MLVEGVWIHGDPLICSLLGLWQAGVQAGLDAAGAVGRVSTPGRPVYIELVVPSQTHWHTLVRAPRPCCSAASLSSYSRYQTSSFSFQSRPCRSDHYGHRTPETCDPAAAGGRQFVRGESKHTLTLLHSLFASLSTLLLLLPPSAGDLRAGKLPGPLPRADRSL